MRAKSLILFVIAVGCGLAASIGVSQYMENAAGGPGVETVKIFVAMTDISIGEKLDAQTVKLEEWPKDRVPEGAVSELAEVEDKFSATRMYAGEPILKAKLLDSNNSGATQTIPKGFRAVPVKVSAETAGGGLIQPGDRVDVLVMLRKSNEVPETGTRTILRDVNVFSVDGATERSIDETGQAHNLNTVSLLLKPKQAEGVLLACELGRLMLTLRRPDDDAEDVSEGETVQSLLGSGGEKAGDKKPSSPPDNGFADWLAQMSNPQSAAQPAPATGPTPAPPTTALPPEPEGPKWKLVIMGPNGSQQYYWTDEAELPVEGTFDATHPTRSAVTPSVATPVPLTGTPFPVKPPTPAAGPVATAASEDSAEAEEDAG